MDLREETIAILNKYGLRANKKLGQNFLINESIIYDIVKKANVTKEDVVIEIGPGLGSLTKELINNAKKVIAIELDPNMIDILKSRFGIFDNFEVIYGDVLKIDLEELIKGYDSVKVVANLPYYITTPIIMKLLEDNVGISLIEVMVQKEVAERLCATPTGRDYGAITVAVNYYSKPGYIVTVPSKSFLPAPDVDSAVVMLEVYDEPKVKVDKDLFFSIVKAAFSQKRKTLLNSLGSANVNGINKEKLTNILTELGIDLNIRAERLSLEDFENISIKYLNK